MSRGNDLGLPELPEAEERFVSPSFLNKFSQLEDPSVQIDFQQALQDLRQFVEIQIPSERRKVLEMIYGQKMTRKKVAEALSVHVERVMRFDHESLVKIWDWVTDHPFFKTLKLKRHDYPEARALLDLIYSSGGPKVDLRFEADIRKASDRFFTFLGALYGEEGVEPKPKRLEILQLMYGKRLNPAAIAARLDLSRNRVAQLAHKVVSEDIIPWMLRDDFFKKLIESVRPGEDSVTPILYTLYDSKKDSAEF